MYKKVCKYCGGKFESVSRGTRYCCAECRDKAQIKRISKNKSKKRRREEYSENKDINRALSKAYQLCETVANLYKIPVECDCKDEHCKGKLQRHHKDCNPFNNSPWNIVYLCEYHHKQVHREIPDVNMVAVYAQGKYIAESSNDDSKMVDYIKHVFNKG